MPGIILYREEEQEWLLSKRECLARIANAFRRVSIDWVRGDAEYAKYRDKILSLNPPDVLREALPPKNQSTVWVSIADQDEPGDWVNFLLDQSNIYIEFPSEPARDRLRPTVNKLASLLEYQTADDD